MAKTINQAQVDVLRTKFLQTIGASKTSFDTPVADDILAQYAKAFIEEAQKNLIKDNSIASGDTSSELTFNIENTGSNVIISIGYPADSNSAKYYDFINKGVAGVGKTSASPYKFKSKYPSTEHVSAIKKWLTFGKAKIRARDVGKYGPTHQEKKHNSFRKQATTDQVAFSIAMGVKKKGIKATHFFDNAIASVFDKDFIKVISKAIGADVQLQIHQAFNNN